MRLSNRTKENLSIAFFILAVLFLAVFAFCGGMIVQGTNTDFSNALCLVSGLITAACSTIGLILSN